MRHDVVRDLRARDAGHHDIGHEDVDLAAELVGEGDRLRPVAHGRDVVARALEERDRHVADDAVVLDHEDPARPVAGMGVGGCQLVGRLCVVVAGSTA